jgi:hypothetical protein
LVEVASVQLLIRKEDFMHQEIIQLGLIMVT